MVEPNRFYSLGQFQALTGIKSRDTARHYIESGHLEALSGGTGWGKRYLIRGSWIIRFSKLYESGKFRYSRVKRFKADYLNQTIAFCEKNNIKTIVQLKNYEKRK